MVSHYDCEKQQNLRQFNLLNVKQCTAAPLNIQHVSVNARVNVRAKTKRIKAYKCVAYAKKDRKICFQSSVKYRLVDKTVWNHNTMPLPVTLDPLECENLKDTLTVQTINFETTYITTKLLRFWKITTFKND